MSTRLATSLFHELRPELFRVFCVEDSPLYVEALAGLERAAAESPRGIEREDALAIIEREVEQMAEGVVAVPTRERARAALEYLAGAGWLETEQGNDWRRVIHFHPNGQLIGDGALQRLPDERRGHDQRDQRAEKAEVCLPGAGQRRVFRLESQSRRVGRAKSDPMLGISASGLAQAGTIDQTPPPRRGAATPGRASPWSWPC